MKALLLTILSLLHFTAAYGQLTTHPFEGMLGSQKGVISLHDAVCTNIRQDGKEAIWHFTFDKNTTETIKYSIKGDSLLFLYLPGSIIRLTIGDKGTSLLSQENPLAKLVYTTPMPVLPGTISYGDSISATFSMAGRYCQKYILRGNGIRNMVCDAYGTIIENGRDTINDVLRVRCTDTTHMSTSLPAMPDSTDGNMLKTGETFIWIDQHTGLPIYKHDNVAYGDNTDAASETGHTVRLSFTAACGQEQDNTHSDGEKHDNNTNTGENNGTISYNVVNQGDAITVNYDLQEAADIAVTLCDVAGISYFSDRRTCPAGNGYSVRIDTSGLRRGNYVIYISANGNTYNCKIGID